MYETYIHNYIHTYKHIHTYMYVYVCTYIKRNWMYVYMCMCMYINVYNISWYWCWLPRCSKKRHPTTREPPREVTVPESVSRSGIHRSPREKSASHAKTMQAMTCEVGKKRAKKPGGGVGYRRRTILLNREPCLRHSTMQAGACLLRLELQMLHFGAVAPWPNLKLPDYGFRRCSLATVASSSCS